VEDKAALGLDGAAKQDWDVVDMADRQIKLPEHTMQAKPHGMMADTDAQCPRFIMAAHRDDGAFKARIADAGHGEEQLARKESRLVH
jgi:hypothetical protein